MTSPQYMRFKARKIMSYELKYQKKCKICNCRLLNYKDINHGDWCQAKVVDHIIPISKGGDNKKSNLQVICFSCNQKKRHYE